MKMKRLFTLMVFLCAAFLSQAQTSPGDDKGAVAAIKTNLPYWGVGGTFNLGAEFRLARHWTLDLEAGLNPFDGKNDDGSYDRTMKHFRAHPELRYWFCESFQGHFLGLHVPFIAYNFADLKVLDLENERRQGWGTDVGVSYGYQWLLHEHWNLEATLGVGYLYLNYDKFPCKNCGNKSEDNKKHYFGPTQAAVSLIYLF